MGKTHRKNQPQGRTRTTRSSKPRLVLSDPNESSAQLDNQLRSLGLYAANTLGDGNCLFRALSDQLYGSPSKHAQLRQDICDFIVKHKSRYEPFVEDERGLDVHIRCMRENGTYGGHLELSSFAHMVKRNVKVIQPGLVYVIEWDAGLDEQERQKALRQLEAEEHDDTISKGTIYVAYHDWEHFSSIRNLKGPHSGFPNVQETAPAYQDPPAAITPKEREREAKRQREKERKEREKARKLPKVKLKLSAPSPIESTLSTSQDPADVPLPESQVPSSSSTPAPEVPASSSASPPHSTASQLSLPSGPIPSALPHSMRIHRSPKRTFDESTSSEDGQSVADDVERSRGVDKRSRIGSLALSHQIDTEQDADTDSAEKEREETPGLSAPGSSSSSSSSSAAEDDEEVAETNHVVASLLDDDGYSSLSELESLPPSPGPTSVSAPVPARHRSLEPTSASPMSKRALKRQQHLSHMPAHHQSASARGEKPLTRRQRKALGLPKPRAALVFGADNNSPGAGRVSGAGKIIIPGGRYQGRNAVKVREFRDGEQDEGGGEEVEEWVRTGVGRVDVRGFRELKI
ncbi:hypothetical protein CC1G_11715 [Coprinopsis cinerea okayama7|uniref:OTU domain-containing protein n=1 Tax=Coprinopsis cinerea (strain Okayama-7 / 130 / ATCC MYA-4618 / FGSC 9003) TaxID=240176 RepID=A8NJW0_COPC7|nr:hypothetical protein CC1G_11715 [Coprinopsis cinerea okayama7\|eukprot:XP_001834306.1 hypothetical protein CC1G_11715 [Coprinopsis cinerea okayama7\